MQWDNDATQLVSMYSEDLRRACATRGTESDLIVNRFTERLHAQIVASGAEVVSAEFVRGLLAATGTPEEVAAAGSPPPLPPPGAHMSAPSAVPIPPRQRASSGGLTTCFVVFAVGVGGLIMISMLAAILLPALARAREAARRAACQNSMKQVGILLKIYANDHNFYYPPLSNELDHFMFADALVPEFDPELLQCPSDPEDAEMSGPDYIYLGYTVRNQEEVEALVQAYLAVDGVADALTPSAEIAAGGTTLSPLRMDTANPETVPVLVEFAGIHVPGDGANVLYLDGHVEYLKLDEKFPMTTEFFEAIGAVWE